MSRRKTGGLYIRKQTNKGYGKKKRNAEKEGKIEERRMGKRKRGGRRGNNV